MDMGRPDHTRCGGIMKRLYGFELVAAVGASRCCAKSLEIGIEQCRVCVVRVCITSKRIGLPDFDIGSRNGTAGGVDYTTPNNDKLTLCAPRSSRDPRKIAAAIGLAHDGVKRTQDLVLCPP